MLRRAAVVCAGLGLGIAVAVLLVPLGLAIPILAGGEGSAGLARRVVDVVVFVSMSPQPARTVAAAAHAAWPMVTTICCLPVIVVALIGEAGRLRGFSWYAGGTAIVTAAIPVLLAASRSDATSGGLPGRTEELVLLGIGACAGFAYWLVAGE